MTELINQANKYLNGDLSYDEGISIFSQLSRNKFLIRVLSSKPTPAKERKLHHEISQLTKRYETSTKNSKPAQTNVAEGSTGTKPVDATQLTEETNKDFPSSDRHSYISDSDADPGLKTGIELKRKELYRLRGHLHGSLHKAVSDQDRYTIALKIMDTQQEIDSVNKDLRSIDAGHIPSKYLKQDKTADQFVQIRNAKMYISRFEKKVQSAKTIDERNKYQEILDKHRANLKSLV